MANTSSLPSQMRGAHLKGYNKGYTIESSPVPTPSSPNDVIIRIRAAGFCHTDLQVEQGVYDAQGSHPGVIGSHEPAGEIAAVGSGVDASKWKVGDRVGTVTFYGYDETCESCKIGVQLCDHLKGMLGITQDGGFAEYCKADARSLVKLPDSIPWAEAAPLFCAGATIWGGITAVAPKPGQWVALIGVGGLGHLGLQYLKALGCKVIALDNRPEGIDVAEHVPEHLRPDKTFLISNDDERNKVADELSKAFYDSNPGVDSVVIATEDPKLPAYAQKFLRKGGIICDVGLPAGVNLEVDAFALCFKEQTLKGKLLCTPDQAREMVKLHHENGCKVHIDKTFTVDEANEMLEHYQSKKLKGRVCMVF